MRDVLAEMEARVPRWGLTSSNALVLKDTPDPTVLTVRTAHKYPDLFL